MPVLYEGRTKHKIPKRLGPWMVTYSSWCSTGPTFLPVDYLILSSCSCQLFFWIFDATSNIPIYVTWTVTADEVTFLCSYFTNTTIAIWDSSCGRVWLTGWCQYLKESDLKNLWYLKYEIKFLTLNRNSNVW